jgi:hypothetical protein
MQHKRRLIVDLSEKQKSAIIKRCDSGQMYARESLPTRRARTDLDPELASTAEHRANADRLASASIADLVELGVHAMKAQEQSQGSNPEVCGVGIPVLHRHSNSTLRGYTSAFDVPSHEFPNFAGVVSRR